MHAVVVHVMCPYVFLVLIGCSGGPPIYDGAASASLGAPGNQATCHTCHSNDGTQAGFPGNSMKNIAYRKAFKGGATTKLIIAVDACTTEWMGGAALTEDSPTWKELERYLQSISDFVVIDPNPFVFEVFDEEPEALASFK